MITGRGGPEVDDHHNDPIEGVVDDGRHQQEFERLEPGLLVDVESRIVDGRPEAEQRGLDNVHEEEEQNGHTGDPVQGPGEHAGTTAVHGHSSSAGRRVRPLPSAGSDTSPSARGWPGMSVHACAEPGARSGPQSGRSVAQAIGTGPPSSQVPRSSRGAPLSTELPRSTRSVGIAAASRPPDNWYQAQLDHREMAHRWGYRRNGRRRTIQVCLARRRAAWPGARTRRAARGWGLWI